MTGTNDKLRSLFLTVLMVVSVFGGTVAFTGTAAAANEAPGIISTSEHEGQLSIAFNKSIDNDLTAEDVTVYIRDAGQGDFDIGSVTDVSDAADGNAEIDDDNGRYIIEGDWDDLSPADEVKVDLGTVEATQGEVTAGNEFGNVTVSLSAARLEEDGNANSEGNAIRVYQGSPVLFQADGENDGMELRNVDTGNILFDGSTGTNSVGVTYPTDDLEPGATYRIIYNTQNDDGEDEVSQYFNVSTLDLSASIGDNDGRLYEHNEDVRFTVEGDARLGNGEMAIEVTGESDHYRTVTRSSTGDFSKDVNLDRPDAGDYTVSVIDVETGVEITAGEFSVDEFPAASSASFGSGVSEDERGDVVEIPINLANSEEGAQATVALGSKSETNYVTNVTVADEDGDGEVVLEWNTYMSGTNISDRIFTAQGDDNISAFGGESGDFVNDTRRAYAESQGLDVENFTTSTPSSSIDYASVATIDPASYDLMVVANDDEDNLQDYQFNFTGVDEDDVGAASINSRSTESSTVWVAPAGKVDQVDLDFIDENTDNTEDDIDGNLTQADQATNGELIVHEVSASGLEGIIRNRTDAGTNATQAFLNEESNYADDNELSNAFPAFTAAFEEENVGPNRDRRRFNLDTTNTKVIPDHQNDTYYIAVKLGGVDEDKLVDGDVWNASFGFEEYDSIGPVLGGEGGGTVYSAWTYENAEASLNTDSEDRVVIRNQDEQTIRGSTNVAPGTQLGLRINSQSDTSPFLETLNAHVSEDRTFAATGDFSNRGAGINFTVNVRRGGDRIGGPYDGRILATATSSVSVSDQQVAESNQEVVVDSATLSDGGFIAIHEESAGGDVIGVSRYLEAGQHQNVRVDLDTPVNDTATVVAMPHLDDNSNNLFDFPEADAPYTADDGSPVTDDASVSLDTETPTPTPTETPSPTPTPTDEPTPTPTDEPTPTPTDEPTPTDADDGDEGDDGEDTPSPTTTADDGPGFGVAVSLIALLAAALLTARRRD